MAEKKEYLKQLDEGKVESNVEKISKQEDRVKLVKESLAFMQKEFDLTEKIHPIMLKGLAKVEPTFKYEEMDEYWNLQRELGTIAQLRELNTKKTELERVKGICKTEEDKLVALKGE